MLPTLDPIAAPRTAEKPLPEPMQSPSLGVKLANLGVIVVPLIGLVVAIVMLWGWGFGWVDLGIFLGMYYFTSLGITMGFHRLFTHRSFETTGWMRTLLAILGSMAAQGSVNSWVAMHRRHHQHSDREGDPHSPNLHGDTFLGIAQGLYHAHMGWMFSPRPVNIDRYSADLNRNKMMVFVSNLFPLWVGLGLLIPTVLGGLLTMTWMGALMGLLWGGFVRMFLFHHVTWGVNSICHMWGSRPYKDIDLSTNNALIGVLALGEGWHNNHHAFPTSARHGLRWWQLDIAYLTIRALSLVGLTWKIKLPANKNRMPIEPSA